MHIFFNAICLTACSIYASPIELDETSDYFNTSFLIHYDSVNTKLRTDGFQDIHFLSDDNLRLNGLWLERESASCNVILCCGFYPGRKEGLAAFYHLLPEDSNICMFDARGHGSSEGAFFSRLPFYGIDEYKDVIGALRFVTEKNNQPIILLGMCAGAYHSLKAIHHLQTTEQYDLLPTGIIFDSSIFSLSHAAAIPKKYFLHSILPNLLRKNLYPNYDKATVKKSLLYTLCSWGTLPLLTALEYFFYPCTLLRNDLLDLRPLCSEIKIPTFFVHAQNDAFAPCNVIQQCSNNAFRLWLPEQAEHACIYLQHKKAYQAHLYAFIADILTTP